ncbi:Reverse transcriptase (RNA-dependent DNA polymerase) [Symmachiella macrocystis]|uniref:Reverse transcriptase (RNA-dependent DNA polymerase) n=1 Tax=Symmachiella macrocystis TaxID=2527985 RepID=A0A5C6BEJ6_9PLAN|nr:reverse transcriptase domain-containing protein [Symmachiella macrocystis]TWU08884.1 Reverse transcriptase (RNA-dependent DNA polymerase) [Symmachiella macrocystis]
MPKIPKYMTSDFVADDHIRGFFPLDSTLAYIKHGESEIHAYVYDSIFDKNDKTASFLTAPMSYALKDSCHLRKVLALDPVSTFYLYDAVLTHAPTYFQESRPDLRRRYGYSFKRRKPLSPTDQYHDFRRAKYELKAEYKYFAKVDISNCFNSFYHHDVAQFVGSYISHDDEERFGQFLREINSGTSVNCFPQGLYPAKTVGNHFLAFVEESAELRSPAIIRFLDDIYLFSNVERTLRSDVLVLQQMLGSHNLCLNADKTRFGSKGTPFDERNLDAVKKRLLQKREEAVGYDDTESDEVDLEEAEREYLEQIVNEDRVLEEDLELALALIDEGSTIIRLVELVCDQHPHLIKHLHRLFSTATFDDDGACWDILTKRVSRSDISEFELFWIAKIAIHFYEFDHVLAEFLTKIYKHTNASNVVQAVVLECLDNKHGFLEMKESVLRNSPGSIAGIAALMGLREANKSKRNQLCNYVAKSGLHMKVYSDIVKRL